MTGQQKPSNGFKEKFPEYGSYLLLAIIMIFTIFIRVRLLDVPLERDEGEYAYTARLLLDGIPPYTKSYDLKMPGLHAIYAVFLTLFGNSVTGIHLGLMLFNIATIVLVFFLGRKLFDPKVGAIASASFAIMSLSKSVFGFTTNAEPLLLLPVVAGLLMLLYAIESKALKRFFLSGLLFGTAFIIKQPALFFIAFSGLYLLYEYFRKGEPHSVKSVSPILYFVLGSVIPFSLLSFVFIITGLFNEFIYWTFQYALLYGSAVSLSEGIDILYILVTRWLYPLAPIFLLSLFGTVSLLRDKKKLPKGIFLALLLLFSFLACALGLYFRPHYFILLFPGVALGAGVGAKNLFTLCARFENRLAKNLIPTLIVSFLILFIIFIEKQYMFSLTPDEVSRSVYSMNPFIESKRIGEYIKNSTSSDDLIAVVGSEPQIYFYSERRSATSHIVMYPLTGETPSAFQMQAEMIAQIEQARPKYIVYVRIQTSWMMKPKSLNLIFGWVKEYTTEHYDKVGIIDIPLNGETTYLWDDDVAGYAPKSDYWIFVLRRKDV